MNIILAIFCVVSAIVIVGFIAVTLCRAGAMADYNRALAKCEKCKHFYMGDRKNRLLYCLKSGSWSPPEEVMNCRKFEEK